jgi:hypothetical protein
MVILMKTKGRIEWDVIVKSSLREQRNMGILLPAYPMLMLLEK